MTEESISSRSTKAFLWGVGGAVGKVVSQLLVQITLARILGPITFGQFAAVLAVFGLGYTLADGGFGSALIQKKEMNSADVSLALGWSLMLAGVIALLIVLLAPFIARQFGDPSLTPLFRLCAILIPIQIVSNISSSLLRRDLHLRGIQVIHLISYTFCFGGVAIVFATLGWGVWSLLIGFAVQTIFSLVATYAISRHTLLPRLTGDRAVIHFGLKSLATEVTTWCMDNLDRFLVGKFWGIYSLGLYSVAYNLSKAPSGLLVYSAQTIAFASAARLQGDVAAVRKGFLIALSVIALATLPIFTLVALNAEVVLHIVYGDKWVMAAPYMAALAITVPLISMGAIAASIMRGIGNVGIELRILIAAAVVLFSAFLFLHDTSLSVAVWAVPFAYLVRFLLLLVVLHKKLELQIADLLHSFRGAFVLSAIGLCVATLVLGLSPAASIGTGVMAIVAGSSAILLMVVVKFAWVLGNPLVSMVRGRFSNGRLGAAIVWLAGERS
jgi:O-antigen/teichoic acid export membrane protein